MQFLTLARQKEGRSDLFQAHSLLFLWRLVRQSKQENTLHDLGRCLEYVCRLLPYWPWVSGLRRRFSDITLRQLLLVNPTLLDRVRRPYQDRRWGVSQRYQAMISHYDWMLAQFDSNTLESIYLAEGRQIAEIQGAACVWHVRLMFDRKFDREGELVLALFTATGQRLATLAFTITGTANSRTLRIGGLQGDKGAGHDVFRHFTKDCHGLRPLALTTTIAQNLAQIWGCRDVLAISNKEHIYQHWRYQFRAMHCVQRVYDPLWDEQGGVSCQGWYRLPLPAKEHNPASAPSNKRAMYRRRQVMMALLKTQLTAGFTAGYFAGAAIPRLS